MTRREKLIERMGRSPGAVRFSEGEALLRYEGFVLFNARGSDQPTTTPTGGSSR